MPWVSPPLSFSFVGFLPGSYVCSAAMLFLFPLIEFLPVRDSLCSGEASGSRRCVAEFRHPHPRYRRPMFEAPAGWGGRDDESNEPASCLEVDGIIGFENVPFLPELVRWQN